MDLGEKSFKRSKLAGGILAFVIPLALFMSFCVVLHIAPFGDRTFIYEDMKLQYLDFYAYYRAVLRGQDGFIYSQHAGLGANMLGTWAYYLSSPYLLMFAVAQTKDFPVVLTFFIALKVATIGLTAFLFLDKLDRGTMPCAQESIPENSTSAIITFSNINLPAILCSTAFALSGWVVANMFNSMWLDAIIMAPVVGIGILKVLRGEKRSKLFLAISVMLMIIGNYYIAFITMLFVAIFALILLAFKVVSFKQVFNAALGAIAGAILDLWLIIPAALSLLGSNKDHMGITKEAFLHFIPKAEAPGKDLTPMLVIPKLFSASYDGIEIMDGFPNIYFGAILIVPCILFFLNKKISIKEKLVSALSMAVLTTFFCIKKLDTIAHCGTEPYGYLYRYSFLFSALCIVMAYKVLRNIETTTIKAAVAALAIDFLLLYLAKSTRIRFLDNRTIIINAILAVCGFALTLVLIMTAQKVIKAPKETSNAHAMAIWAIFTIFGVVLSADTFYNFARVYENSILMARSVSEYRELSAKTEEKLSRIRAIGNTNYRIENTNQTTPNESLHFGYTGVTAYNSVNKVENRLLVYRMGFNDNGLYTPYENGNTRTADAILGVKYVMTDDPQPLEGQEIFDEGILINKYVLTRTYVTGETVDSLLMTLDDDDNPFRVQEKILDRIISSDLETPTITTLASSSASLSSPAVQYPDPYSIFIPADLETLNESDDQANFKVTLQADGEAYFYMDRVNLQERYFEIYINGEFITVYGNASCQKILHLGNYRAGEELEIGIKTDGEPIPSAPVVVTEDIEALKACIEAYYSPEHSCSNY